MQTYTVVAGDTLTKIANQFGVSVLSIARSNGIADPNVITVGDELVIGTADGSPTPEANPQAITNTDVMQLPTTTIVGNPIPSATPNWKLIIGLGLAALALLYMTGSED